MYNKTLTYRIKKIQLTLIFVLILISSLNVKAQHNLDHPRGMYVNRFFCFNRNTTNRNINTSILGNIQKENELLQYASDNHITYLILFDVPKIFSDMQDLLIVYQYKTQYASKDFQILCFERWISNPLLRAYMLNFINMFIRR